ncbi:MAG TPA: hypothetical protein VGV89_01230 [Thermoplasmata archaeon]|nr:hypothetical protein [Thermoplasmata archaeon]
MSAPAPPPIVQPLRTGRRSLRWLAPIVGALLGDLALYATYVHLGPELPATVPSHYGLGGTPNAWMAVAGFVEIAIILSVSVALFFAVLLYLLGRSDALDDRFGRSVLGPVSLGLTALVAVSLPALFGFLLVQDSGEWPSGWPSPAVWTPLLLLVPIVLPVPIAIRRVRQLPPPPGGERLASEGSPPSGTGPVFLCSACGRQFVRSAWTLLAPRIGISAVRGGASYFLRCPWCGETGWNTRVGWNRPGAGSN